MFQIVSPAHYAHHEGLIQEYKAKLLEVNDKDIPEEEQRQAFYVICQEGGRGVVGGAYLVKKSVEDLPSAFEEACRSFYRNIYETFMNFSVLQNMPLLLTKLNENDYGEREGR